MIDLCRILLAGGIASGLLVLWQAARFHLGGRP